MPETRAPIYVKCSGIPARETLWAADIILNILRYSHMHPSNPFRVVTKLCLPLSIVVPCIPMCAAALAKCCPPALGLPANHLLHQGAHPSLVLQWGTQKMDTCSDTQSTLQTAAQSN